MKKNLIYIILMFYCCSNQIQPTIVTGDTEATEGNTFSFNIGHARVSSGGRYLSNGQEGSRLWLASGEDLSSKSDDVQKFGLSVVNEVDTDPQFMMFPVASPLANKQDATVSFYNTSAEKVVSSKVPNPIYGAAFAFFDIAINTSGEKGIPTPTFVLQNNLNQVFFAQSLKYNQINQQTGERESETTLLMHAFDSGDEVKALHTFISSIYVAHSVGDFGMDDTSKITYLLPSKYVVGSVKDENGNERQITTPYLQKVAEKEITPSTTQEALGDPASFGTTVTMHTGSNLYIGLDVTADTNGAAGIMAVTTTAIGNNLTFTGILDTAAISSSFDTVLSAINGNNIRISKINNMQTSTSLPYLIVARDSDSDDQQKIYAVPLVSKPGNNFGKVADINSLSNAFRSNSPTTYLNRNFTTPLTDPEQIRPDSFSQDISERLLVGQGAPPIAAGNKIQQLYSVGDAVYVVIPEDYASGQKPGTFHSQAIFAPEGYIISWTPWKRVIGTDEPTLLSNLSSHSTSSFYVSNTGTGFKKAVQTQWLPMGIFSPFFSTAHGVLGGTQGLFSFPQSTPGFDNSFSCLIATGFNKITIGQTGFKDTDTYFKIKTMTSDDVITFNDVNDNRALITAEFAHNGANHWLFAGGASGVTALLNEDGVTWENTLSYPSDFTDDHSWKQVGNFNFVKKLIWDETYLYILTSNALHRILLTPSLFQSATENIDYTTIVEAKNLNNCVGLLDCIIDQGFCIIGTTNGMYVLNNSLTNSQPSKISIPDGLPAITQLRAISKDIESQRSFKENSNLYVLNSTFGTQQTRINRFTIQDGTIKPFNDALLNSSASPNGLPTSFIRFNQYVTNYFTNGSWNLAASYFLGISQPESTFSPAIQQLFPGIANGRSSSQILIPNMSTIVPTTFLRSGDIIYTDQLLGVQQESTSGLFIMTGNFEARVTT